MSLLLKKEGLLGKEFKKTVSQAEMMEVIQLAERGVIHVETHEFLVKDALEVYRKFEKAQIKGRAVLIP